MDLEHERILTEAVERSKSNTKRIDELEKRQDNLDELTGTVKVLALREENVENDVKEIKSDVKVLASKPAQRWDGLVDKVIAVVVGAIFGYIFTQIGL